MPISAMQRPTSSGASSSFTPRVSTTSAEPQSDAPLRPDMERLPCLATLRPVPATTNAVAVETLNVPEASPPVPHVSINISRSVPVSDAVTSPLAGTRATLSRITCAKPMSSSTVSPFIRSAVRNAAIWTLVAAPDMIASIAAAASMRVRSRRSTRTRIASVMIGLVMPAPPSPPSRSGPSRVPYPPGADGSGLFGAGAVVVEIRGAQLVEPAPDGPRLQLGVGRAGMGEGFVRGDDGRADPERQREGVRGMAAELEDALAAAQHERRRDAALVAVDLGAHDLEPGRRRDLPQQIKDGHARSASQHPGQTVGLVRRQVEGQPVAAAGVLEQDDRPVGLL